MEATDAAAPLSGPHDAGHLARRERGRLERLLVHVADGRRGLAEVVRLGRSRICRAGRCRRRAALLLACRHASGSIFGSPGTDFIWGGGRLATAWPAGADDNAYSKVRTSHVPTLLIGGSLDGATPPQNATRELLPHLPNGHQVILPNLGHTVDFWSYEPKASSRLVNTLPGQRQGRRLRSTRARMSTSRRGSLSRRSPRSSRARWSASLSSRCSRCC